MNPWPPLLRFPGPSAFSATWREHLAEAYEPFSTAFLEPKPRPVSAIRCPRRCGCSHLVTPYPDGSFVARCICEPPACAPLRLTLQEVTGLKLSWSKLGRALCAALSLDPKPDTLNLYNTQQIGSWSPSAIPVILTIQLEPFQFRNAVAELVAQLRQPFILLAPTTGYLDAHCQTLQAGVGAACFGLDSTVRLTPQGTLQPIRPPAELFAQFSVPSILIARPAAPLALDPRLSTLDPSLHPSTLNPQPSTVRYALRKGGRVWHVTFDSQPAEFLHERGAFYVAYLLLNPPEHPIHALDLIGKIPEMYRHQFALTHIADPNTGKLTTLESHARLQERSLALDDAQTMRALQRKERELEAILESDEIEPVKAEALRELEAITQFQRQHGSRSKDGAQRPPHAIRMAIARFHHHLATALDEHGNPHPVLRPFAEHLNKYLLIPSVRYSGHGNRHARTGLSGCFTYEPPPGVSWTS